MHLYLYDAHGNLVRQLTDGNWVVDSLEGVDKKVPNRLLHRLRRRPQPSGISTGYRSTAAASIESYFRARNALSDSGPRLSNLRRRVQQRRYVADRHAQISRRRKHLSTPSTNRMIPALKTLDLAPPELVTILSRDGDTLHGAVYHPPSEFGVLALIPSVVYVYGGPHAQVVSNHWSMTCALRVQHLRSQGYLVFSLDNRGSARRGAGLRGQHQAQHGRYRSARPSGRRPLAGRPRSRRSRPRRRIRLELRRVYGPDVPLATRPTSSQWA